jgi:hypothetical protein
VNAHTGRLGDALNRLMPFLIVVAIVTVAFFLFIQAPLNAYLRSRSDVAALQVRMKTLQDARARAGNSPQVDLAASIRAFESQMAADDKVSDVTAILAKSVIDHAPADKLRGFSIETGDRIQISSDAARAVPVAAIGSVGTTPDPRLSLFPASVSYTPVKVTFSSTFEAIAGFMWTVKDLPTTVEIKSSTLTRGLPLMKMELLIWVYQRGSSASPEPGVAPSAPGAPVSGAAPVGPRVARLMGAEG